MNLYVWNNPYPVTYGASVLYVVAESEEQARALAPSAMIRDFGMESRKDAQLQHAYHRLGAPDRVLPVPCAEVYEWSE